MKTLIMLYGVIGFIFVVTGFIYYGVLYILDK